MPAPEATQDISRVLAEFDVGELVSSQQLPSGSRDALRVATTTGTFILKPAYRRRDVELQATVAAMLNARGIRQPSVIPTRAGHVVASSGHVLLEFLPGSAPSRPTRAQTAAAMRHVADYHGVLGELALRYTPDQDSVWQRVAELGFLIDALPDRLAAYGLADEATKTALRYLSETRCGLAALPRQVVHGDIGPDNILMDGNAVVSLIDFTPYFEAVLFAASTALYWYHVYGSAEVSPSRLWSSMATMSETRPWTREELALWPAALVRETLRRLATPLELAHESRTEPGPSAGPRLFAVRALVPALPKLRQLAETR